MRLIDGDALMKDLVDAIASQKRWMDSARKGNSGTLFQLAQQAYLALLECKRLLEKAPTITPSVQPERKKGIPLLEKREWIEGYTGRWYRKKFFCPSCGIKIRTESWDENRCFGEGTILQENNMPNYCPNCGADMRGEQNETTD